MLFRSIERYFSMDEEKRRELGIYGRKLIIDNYSVIRMTDDTVKIYERVLN